MKSKTFLPVLFFAAFFLFCQQASSQGTAADNWTQAKASKWVKKKEWANGLPLNVHPSTDMVTFAKEYHNNQPVWDKVFTFLKEHKLEDLAPGRYPVDSDNAYINVTENPSKEFDKSNWESHRKYIDLQYVIKGKEKIGVAKLSKATVTKPYDEKADGANYTADGKYYIAQPGEFFLFFPQDVHRPNIKVEGYDVVKKLVVKIKVAS